MLMPEGTDGPSIGQADSEVKRQGEHLVGELEACSLQHSCMHQHQRHATRVPPAAGPLGRETLSLRLLRRVV